MKGRVLSFCIAIFVIISSLIAADVPSYTITDLGVLGDGPTSAAFGVNNSGQVVGWSAYNYSPDHAFYYDGSTMHDLGTLGGDSSVAECINDKGQIVGNYYYHSGYTVSVRYPFLFDGEEMIDLGPMLGPWSEVRCINNNGQIVGQSFGSGFLYDGTTIHDLGEGFSATGINDSGQVAGRFDYRAFLYDGGIMHDLGTLGGSSSEAFGINSSGHVVGESFIKDSNLTHAFYYDGLVMHDLGTLEGGSSKAYAINDNGLIVGRSVHAGTLDYRAFFI